MKKSGLILCLLLGLYSLPLVSGAVSDSTQKAEEKEFRHSPKKAAMYSAVLPGLGQVYNKKYWKIPVIYALGGFTVYTIIQKNREYQLFYDAHSIYNSGGSIAHLKADLEALNKNNPNNFKAYRDEARDARDMFYVYTGLVYALNIVDAVVDAHLTEFDVSSDLSLKIDPMYGIQQGRQYQGLLLTFRF